jgi:hypothetical protein
VICFHAGIEDSGVIVVIGGCEAMLSVLERRQLFARVGDLAFSLEQLFSSMRNDSGASFVAVFLELILLALE